MKDKLLNFFDPNRSILFFIVGTAALTLVLQAFYDFANEPGKWQGGYWLALASLAVAATALVVSGLRRPVPGRVNLAEELKPTQRKGLILLVSPMEAAAPAAIQHHLDTLEHCWILTSKASLPTAVSLEKQYASQARRFHHGSRYVVDEDLIQSTYDMVVRILDEEAPRHGLAGDDLIADITGGLKPMTAGMTLACLARHCDMQYMKTLRDKSGTPVPEAVAEPIQIDAKFIPETLLKGG
jgi:hypothetical protein